MRNKFRCAPSSPSFKIPYLPGSLFPALAQTKKTAERLFECLSARVASATSEQGLEKVKIRGHAFSLACPLIL